MCLLTKQITEASKTKLCDVRLIKYQFIVFQKTKTKREQWIKSVPNVNLNVTNNSVICQQQWPSKFDTIEVHGKIHPKNPPSVWPVVQRNIKKNLQYC